MSHYIDTSNLPLLKVNRSKKFVTGSQWPTKTSGIITVVGQVDHKDSRGGYNRYRIMFKDGNLYDVYSSNITGKEVKNYYERSVYNVGFVGRGKHKASIKINGQMVHTPEYNLWNGMLRRCYSEELLHKRPTYRGCTVDKRWHNFQNFCEDLPNIQGYIEWKKNKKKHAYALDKDIKIPGNKTYSKDTCLLVTIAENTRECVSRRI